MAGSTGQVLAGNFILAEDVQAELTGLAAGLNVWTAFDAGGAWSMSASVTAPTQGSSTYYAEYLQLHAKLIAVRWRIAVTTGGAWNVGSGDWRFPLPATQTAHSAAAPGGAVWVFDSGVGLQKGICNSGGGLTYVECSLAGVLTRLGSAGPGTAWATGDTVDVYYEMEPA